MPTHPTPRPTYRWTVRQTSPMQESMERPMLRRTDPTPSPTRVRTPPTQRPARTPRKTGPERRTAVSTPRWMPRKHWTQRRTPRTPHLTDDDVSQDGALEADVDFFLRVRRMMFALTGRGTLRLRRRRADHRLRRFDLGRAGSFGRRDGDLCRRVRKGHLRVRRRWRRCCGWRRSFELGRRVRRSARRYRRDEEMARSEH